MDLNPSELEAAMHDALVKVAGPMLEEQIEMRAQLRAQRLLLTLLYAERFRDDRAGFDQLMCALLRLVPQALSDLPGASETPEAASAQRRVTEIFEAFRLAVSGRIVSIRVESM